MEKEESGIKDLLLLAIIAGGCIVVLILFILLCICIRRCRLSRSDKIYIEDAEDEIIEVEINQNQSSPTSPDKKNFIKSSPQYNNLSSSKISFEKTIDSPSDRRILPKSEILMEGEPHQGQAPEAANLKDIMKELQTGKNDRVKDLLKEKVNQIDVNNLKIKNYETEMPAKKTTKEIAAVNMSFGSRNYDKNNSFENNFESENVVKQIGKFNSKENSDNEIPNRKIFQSKRKSKKDVGNYATANVSKSNKPFGNSNNDKPWENNETYISNNREDK